MEAQVANIGLSNKKRIPRAVPQVVPPPRLPEKGMAQQFKTLATVSSTSSA